MRAADGIWTHDLVLTKDVLYPWATAAHNAKLLKDLEFGAKCYILTSYAKKVKNFFKKAKDACNCLICKGLSMKKGSFYPFYLNIL